MFYRNSLGGERRSAPGIADQAGAVALQGGQCYGMHRNVNTREYPDLHSESNTSSPVPEDPQEFVTHRPHPGFDRHPVDGGQFERVELPGCRIDDESTGNVVEVIGLEACRGRSGGDGIVVDELDVLRVLHILGFVVAQAAREKT